MEDVLAALRDYSRAFTVRTKPTSNSRGASKHARTIAKGAQHRSDTCFFSRQIHYADTCSLLSAPCTRHRICQTPAKRILGDDCTVASNAGCMVRCACMCLSSTQTHCVLSFHVRTGVLSHSLRRQPGSYSPASKPAATLAQASPPGQAFAAGVSTHAAAAAIRHVPPTKPAHIPPVLVTVPTLPCAVAPARTRRIHPGFTRKVAMSVPRGRAEGGVDERGTDPRNKHAACEPRKTLPVVPHEVVTIEDSDEECDPR